MDIPQKDASIGPCFAHLDPEQVGAPLDEAAGPPAAAAKGARTGRPGRRPFRSW